MISDPVPDVSSVHLCPFSTVPFKLHTLAVLCNTVV